MNKNDLAAWAAQARPELSAAVATEIREHLAAIPFRQDIYGYALLPDDPSTSADGIGSLTAVYNRPSDISVGSDEDEYTYVRYCVDEWQHWDQERFSRTEAILEALNAEFAAVHTSDPDSAESDEFEQAYFQSLLNAILEGLAQAKSKGVFGRNVEYLVIWMSDSVNEIIEASVRRLNSTEVVEEFLSEFGGG